MMGNPLLGQGNPLLGQGMEGFPGMQGMPGMGNVNPAQMQEMLNNPQIRTMAQSLL